MTTRSDIEKRIAELRLEYRKVFSMLSMMEKGTKREDLVKMREKQLDPITNEIKRLEGELGLLK
jgi:cell division FtsZ-interacting protein ZapD